MDRLFLGVKTNLWGTYGAPDMTHTHVTQALADTHKHFQSSK